MYTCNYTKIGKIYRVSQEECEILRESVPWVKLYRYNPKHLYPKLNGYGDNGQRGLKLWQLLHTYWLPNSYWNWLEYVVSVMLISVLNIKVTCEWHKAIKLNYKNSRIHVFALLRLRNTVHRPPDRFLSCDVRATVLKTFRQGPVWRILRHGRRTFRGHHSNPHFSMAINSVTVQLWI